MLTLTDRAAIALARAERSGVIRQVSITRCGLPMVRIYYGNGQSRVTSEYVESTIDATLRKSPHYFSS